VEFYSCGCIGDMTGGIEVKMDHCLYYVTCADRSTFAVSVMPFFADVEGIYILASGVPDQPAEVCNSYLEEASAGRNVKLHITLFSIDDADIAMKNGVGDEPDVLPCRYAGTSETAKSLRDMAHSTAGGRFHWVRETGMKLCVFFFCSFQKH